MKIVPVLAIAGLMFGSAAFAATGSHTTSAASATTTVASAKPASAKAACRAEAHAKKLAGAERTRFIKECTTTKT
jgi:hypothetical protein